MATGKLQCNMIILLLLVLLSIDTRFDGTAEHGYTSFGQMINVDNSKKKGSIIVVWAHTHTHPYI